MARFAARSHARMPPLGEERLNDNASARQEWQRDARARGAPIDGSQVQRCIVEVEALLRQKAMQRAERLHGMAMADLAPVLIGVLRERSNLCRADGRGLAFGLHLGFLGRNGRGGGAAWRSDPRLPLLDRT